MSFMFNPYPYNDPNAVNHITIDGFDTERILKGSQALADLITNHMARHGGHCIIGLDGYTTAPFAYLAGLVGEAAAVIGLSFSSYCTNTLCRPSDDIDNMLLEYLPMDREKDPVLLYGKVYEGGYEGLFDPDKSTALRKKIKEAPGVTLIYGCGALCDSLRDIYTLKIFADITPKQAVLNVKKGGYLNLGRAEPLPFKLAMRRNYYVDFDTAFKLRKKLLSEGFDIYVNADDTEALTAMDYNTLKTILNRLADYPFRCRPVYLEGVWGGYFVKRLRRLPEEMRNCAWVFDLIPMEVSVVAVIDGVEAEFPYYTFINTVGVKLLGHDCEKRFNGYFPIRFNYDDTFHASGNMSIQLHPGEAFLRENSNELGRQDESYYIVATAQEAKTYLGFKNDADIDGFISDIRRSETERKPVDYQSYINAVKSEPGVQVMIPAGTIHASGRNQLILEIGSLTIGSYTYKMYDYLRLDLDGKPRPIHSYYGTMNLNRDMRADYVNEHLVNGRKRTLRSGDGWEEFVVGECDQLYFSLRNERFTESIEDDTKDSFHVLTLVDGEEVEVRSKSDPSLSFTQKFLDMVVVPASMGEYEVINKKPGTVVTMHKTLLKPACDNK